MTYHDNRDPRDLSPGPGYDRRPRQGDFMWMIGLAVLLSIGVLAMITMGRDDRVATDNRPTATAPSTSGSATREATDAPLATQRPATPAPVPK